MQVRPLDNSDQLPLPSPKLVPSQSRRSRVRTRRRHSGPRLEPPITTELALSTIAEESSQNHSTSSISVNVDPEVLIESSPPPPPYSGVVTPVPVVTVASPACCVCHAARVQTTPSCFLCVLRSVTSAQKLGCFQSTITYTALIRDLLKKSRETLGKL